ncbi:hypothetical protein [Phenylobacterium sp.]|uniref:hypothetical protein n=1 Tax=Phenylobacterium sp. TaxID=1871053 RepID=UPI0035688346
MAGSNERIYRSLRGLEKTASTSRVLNLAVVSGRNAGNPEHLAKPLFKSPVLNGAVILKHRLRADEADLFESGSRTATKIIVPFDRSDLALGGRAVFVGERGWLPMLTELRGGADDITRDVEILESIDQLPSLDPFLLREHIKRRGYEVSPTYFDISPADVDRMQRFVGGEIARLIELAYGGAGSGGATGRLVEALLSSKTDERLEPLRLTLQLEGESYREGIFCWKGFLYYKWVLNTLWPRLKEVLVEVTRVRVEGPRERDVMIVIEETKVRLRNAMETQVKAVMGYLKAYDQVFQQLTDGNAIAFRDFLLKSPEMFMSLGEGAGTVSHVASFWRFRFPVGKQLTAPMAELLEILQDFEAGLGAEPHPLSYAA